MDNATRFNAGARWRIVRSLTVLALALGTTTQCAPDETLGAVDAAAADQLANRGHKGWWGTKQTLRIVPDSGTLSGPGDTLRLSAFLLEKRNSAPVEVEANWALLDQKVVTIEGPSSSTHTVLLRGRKPGEARVVAVHEQLATIAHLSVGDESPAGPVAAIVSGVRPTMEVGDTTTIRPDLIDADSAVIPTETADWSIAFDSLFLSISEDLLVTALAPTEPDSPTTIRLVHIATELAVEADVTVGTDEEPGPVAAIVSGARPLMVVGDTTTIRPDLIDADSTVIPTETSEWSVAFDSLLVSISEDLLVTALEPTQSGSPTVIRLVHIATELAVEVGLDILPDGGGGEPGENLTPAALFNILGPLVARGTESAPELTRYDFRYRQTELERYCCGTNSYKGGQGRISSHHYGALLSRLNWSIRNGEPFGPEAADPSTAYGRGREIVRDYLHNYAAPNQHGVQAHNNTGLADIEAYYVLEGDPVARQHIWVTAMAATTDRYGYLNFTNSNSDARQPDVNLAAAAAAHRLGIPWARASNTSRGMDMSHGSWIGAGRWLIDHMLTPTGDPNKGFQPDGSIWSPAHAGQAGSPHNEAYLFNAMLARTLLQWWGWVDPYPAAYEAAKRIMDHILDVDAAAEAMGRTTIPYLTNSNGSSAAAEDLAGFYVWPALVLWQETGDTRYRTFALRQLAAVNRTSSISAVKQWNQIFSMNTQGAEALLAGVPWR